MTARPRSGPGLPGPEGDCLLAAHRDLALAGTEVLHREAGDVGGDVLGAPLSGRHRGVDPNHTYGGAPPLGSDNPRSIDFPGGLIGGATSGRLRHVPGSASAAGYFAAFSRSARPSAFMGSDSSPTRARRPDGARPLRLWRQR